MLTDDDDAAADDYDDDEGSDDGDDDDDGVSEGGDEAVEDGVMLAGRDGVVCGVGAGSVGGWVVEVRCGSGSGKSQSSSGRRVWVEAVPTVTSIVPSSIPELTGGVVTLSGTGFRESVHAMCRVGRREGSPGATNAVQARVMSPTSAECTLPSRGANGAGNTTVEMSNDGVHWSRSGVRVNFAPSTTDPAVATSKQLLTIAVSSIQPSTVALGSGAAVTVTASGLPSSEMGMESSCGCTRPVAASRRLSTVTLSVVC